MSYFVLVFFCPFSIAITSPGEERANLSAFRTFGQFTLVLFCLFPLPLGVWEGLRFAVCGTPWTFLFPFYLLYFALHDIYILLFLADRFHDKMTKVNFQSP